MRRNGTRNRPGEPRFLLWGRYVYELKGHVDDVDGHDEGKRLSGFVATKSLVHRGKVYEPGDELPAGRRFYGGKGTTNIPVCFDSRMDFEAMLERGDVKRKRGRPRK